MKRLLHLLGSATLVTVAVLWSATPAASADAPAAAGWWTSLNPGSTLGSPTPPPPPDVPADGLLIEGGADASPTAFAGLVYQLPAGVTASRLTLTVASNSATTPASSLELCPLTNPAVIADHGGPMSDAPTYRCTRKVTAAPSTDGKTYRFNAALLVVDSALAVAVLPTAGTDRVVLAAPSASSLTVVPGASSTDAGGQVPPAAVGAGASSFTSPSQPSAPDPGLAAAPSTVLDIPAVTSGGVPVAAGPSSAVAAAPPPPTPSFQASSFAPSSSPTRPAALALVVAVLLVGGGLWEAAGRSATRAALELSDPA